MLVLSAILLGVTALLGMGLLALHQWVRPVGWMRLPGAVHGLSGLAGFAVLLSALGGPPRGAQSGAGAFGGIAAALFAGTLAFAVATFVARRRGSGLAPLVLGLHATLAVAGLTMLAAYLSAPA